jgi:hypothetical protein
MVNSNLSSESPKGTHLASTEDIQYINMTSNEGPQISCVLEGIQSVS